MLCRNPSHLPAKFTAFSPRHRDLTQPGLIQLQQGTATGAIKVAQMIPNGENTIMLGEKGECLVGFPASRFPLSAPSSNIFGPGSFTCNPLGGIKRKKTLQSTTPWTCLK
jgi:hypothetical protein